jgi:hypothetical protein
MFFTRRPGQSAAQFIAMLAGKHLGYPVEETARMISGADSSDMMEILEEAVEQFEGNLGGRERAGVS